MFLGHGFEFLFCVGPRQQLVDVVVEMAVDDAREDVGQISERVDIVQLASFDQGGDGRPMLGAAIKTSEQCILPIERNWADGSFDDVVVEFDAAVVDEARQALPARQGVANGSC